MLDVLTSPSKQIAMPDFIYDHKMFYNPVEFALKYIGGTWKMPILWRLNKATLRYSELKKTLPHITHKVLSSQLKELEETGLISKSICIRASQNGIQSYGTRQESNTGN